MIALRMSLLVASLLAPPSASVGGSSEPGPVAVPGTQAAALPEQASPIVIAGAARFTLVTPTLVRLEYQADGRFVDAPSTFATERAAGERHYRLDRRADGSLELDSGRLVLSYRPDGQPFRAANLRVELSASGRSGVTWRPGDQPRANLGGTVPGLDGVAGPIDLGRGLIARDGWALVDDSNSAIETGGWYANRPPDRGLDWYLFGYGSDFRAAFSDLAAIAGPVPMPRRAQLGSWFSRWASFTSAEFRAVVAEYQSHGFPLDVMVMDMGWHRPGWVGWSWDRALLPDAEALLQELHAAGLAVTLNIHPGDVTPAEDRYPELMRALGLDPATGNVVPFDAGDRRYLDALYDEVQAPLASAGVDFWWLDWASTGGTRSVPALGTDTALNRYYFERTAGSRDRGASFSRWAGLGDHRHPIHFSGDAYSHLGTLEFEIPFTATAGNVGCFFWSHDIGGFRGPFNAQEYDQIYARWVQFGALSAALRIHSYVDKRPWLYKAFATESMRRSFELRSRLFPYIYTSVAQSTAATWPLIRPMYLDHPGDARAYRNPLQYLLGDQLLVAPITTLGYGPARVARRPVWFPRHGDWFDIVSGERHTGLAEELVSASIDEIPAFAPGGVPIPMQMPSPRMTSGVSELVVRAWPGADGGSATTELYEDDGVSREHASGARARTALSYQRSGLETTVDVAATRGSYAGQPAERALTVELPGLEAPVQATLDGASVVASYDPATFTARVAVPRRSIRQPARVKVWAAGADPAAIHNSALLARLAGILGQPAADWKQALGRPELDEAARNAILALEGYGVVLKNEALVLLPAEERLYALGPEVAELLPLEVYTFFRTSWQAGEERFPAFALPRAEFPLPLDVTIPADKTSGPAGALGERRVRGVAVRFSAVDVPATWSVASEYSWITAWHVAGPYPADRLAGARAASAASGAPALPPVEAEPRGRSRVARADQSARGTRPRPSAWRTLTTGPDGILDLAVLGPPPLDQQTAYSYVRLAADREQDVTLAMSSDDYAVALVDNVEVYRQASDREISHTDLVKVHLTAGDHILMVQVTNNRGDWKLRVGVESAGPIRSDLQ